MHNTIKALLIFGILGYYGASFAASSIPEKVTTDKFVGETHHLHWFKESFLDLQDDLSEAADADKKGVMLMFTTEGCSYCAMFVEKSLKNPTIAALTQKYFDVIGMEIFDDSEMVDTQGNPTRVKDFAYDIGAGMAPSIFFFGPDGKQLLKAVGYQSPERYEMILDYLGQGHHEKTSLKTYIAQQKAGVKRTAYQLKTDKLFYPAPYALDRSRFKASAPLLVIFEKPDCTECNAFHENTLSKKEVRQILREFEVVRMDATDNKSPLLKPDGTMSTPAKWYNEMKFSRLPALAYFDKNGNNVLQTDALVLEGRMMNASGFVLEKAFEKGWNYQRFARSRAIARNLAASGTTAEPR